MRPAIFDLAASLTLGLLLIGACAPVTNGAQSTGAREMEDVEQNAERVEFDGERNPEGGSFAETSLESSAHAPVPVLPLACGPGPDYVVAPGDHAAACPAPDCPIGSDLALAVRQRGDAGPPLLMAALAVEPIDPREFDRARIQRHLAAVEVDLRARDTSHLPPALQRERERNLDRLQAYRLAGEFPRNSDHPGERVPYFIDDDGVVCAVGHLVVESGFVVVAEEIHATENNTRLLDMTHSELPAWIAVSGLTAEECARIQPIYCNCGDDYALVCGVDGKTYYNACYALTCADVAIAHDGPCLGPGTTGWPPAGTDGSESAASETGTGETGTSET